MTIQEANSNIGKPFKLIGFTGGIMSQFDTIIRVDDDGTIHGNYLEAHCDDCRLKQEQPEHLKTHNDGNISSTTERVHERGTDGEQSGLQTRNPSFFGQTYLFV